MRKFDEHTWESSLSVVNATEEFYFDSIRQIVMDSWIKAGSRWSLTPATPQAPAVGGGTSIAVIGAHVLAHELTQVGEDNLAGLPPTRSASATLRPRPADPWIRAAVGRIRTGSGRSR